MRWLILPLLGVALLAASGRCAAQTAIHHCTAADGTPVFTDQPCASLDAMPANGKVNPLAAPGAHAPQHCPLDLGSLRKRVADAFRDHNANVLAGLMLWSGYDAHQATAAVRALAQLMHAPFLGFDDAATPAPATATSVWWPPLEPGNATTILTPVPATILTIKLGDPAQPEVGFQVLHRDGCFWLQPPAAGAGTP